ncbi:MAG: 50S ribosomal protein L33 [Gemmatimonadota bacterium]|nr:MAG: 50S ribosomal protein L33 [Gemmatimonadota bacterium]
MAATRVKITLACTECESRNYNGTKSRQKHPERVEYRKFCRRCGKHTTHKETK